MNYELNQIINHNPQLIAYWDDWELVTVKAPLHTYTNENKFFICNQANERLDTIITYMQNLNDFCYVHLYVESNFIQPGEYFHVIDDLNNKFEIHVGRIIRNPYFDRIYQYTKNDLGCTYLHEKSIFKVWSPIATKMDLILINPQTNQKTYYPMNTNKKNGVWEIEVFADLESFKYLYQVHVNFQIQTATDPYGIASDINGKHSYVINLEKTRNFLEFNHLVVLKKPTSALIYELNVRDFTDHLWFKYQGKFLGLTETNLIDDFNNKIGLDYLVDLNITHVQVMPIFDFATIDEGVKKSDDYYNWGYDPQQYNVPDGSYATDPYNPYARIIELKQMIHALHQKNIGVIMDVVYNHVYSVTDFSWEKLVPGYFFVKNPDNSLSNATGVGNDVNSARLMVRKFILDSLNFWQQEYKFDGFRFDLMGILDVTTIRKAYAMIIKNNPYALVYGEGWIMDNCSPSIKANLNNNRYLPKVGFFNDLFRNAIKGHDHDTSANSYIFGRAVNLNVVKNVITGSVGVFDYNKMFLSPINSINYVEVHDNMTLWDYLTKNLTNYSEAIRKKIHLLGTLLVLVSQGIPFLHAGQELFRSKKMNENSYNASMEYNRFPWNTLNQNLHVINLIKKIIAFRKAHWVFSLISVEQIRKHIQIFYHNNNSLVYCLNTSEYSVRIIINPNNFPVVFDEIDLDWKIEITNCFNPDCFYDSNNNHLTLGEFSFCIIKKMLN